MGISQIIPNILRQLEGDDYLGRGKVFLHWPDIVGDTLAIHSKPFKFRAKKLTIVVDSSPWLYEMDQQYRPKIQSRLDQILGVGQVQEIVFKVGEI